MHYLNLNLSFSFSLILIYGVLILRVYVSDVGVVEDKYHDDSYWIVGRLPSDVEVIIDDYYYDLREYVGGYVDMLLSFMRSPYSELERGMRNEVFTPEKYYSVEFIDELSEKGVISTGGESVVILTGEYIDSYIIPEKWAPLPQRGSFQALFKKPSALKTEDGTFLLYPFHSQKQVPINKISQKVTMAGSLKL